MKKLKELPLALLPIFLIVITFILSITPLRDFDIWFHLKSGEVIAHQGIIHHDVFSYVTQGREWFPYEWLFQVTVYYFSQLFGFESLKFLTAFFTTFIIGMTYVIIKSFSKINTVYALIICTFFYASTTEFYTARPQIIAYSFLLINLYLILLYSLKNKNLLYLTIPVTLLWANLHGSIFIDIFLFLGYALAAFLSFWLERKQEDFNKGKVLGIWAVITVALTILPPLGILQYRLLWEFFLKRATISHFVAEWTPLAVDPVAFWIYTIPAIFILISFIILVWKKKLWKDALWLVPIVPLIPTTYLANRNAFLGSLGLMIVLGWTVSKIKKSRLVILILCIFLSFNIWVFWEKRQYTLNNRVYYPVYAVNFIKHNLHGHMFNEYGYGGYLLYHLYPEQKVFIDGRTDLYICCEIPKMIELAEKKEQTDQQYNIFLHSLWNKYDISFVVLRTEKHTIERKMARILTNDPEWNLIFWDDHSMIFVRNDGKNTDVLNKLSTQAATPYDKDPFIKGREDKALNEYKRMLNLVDSAKSRNAVGYILLKKGNFDQAKQEFLQAVQLDPTNESPYMNLAELAAKDNDYNSAIQLYSKAQSLALDRGLIYIRLGELYIEGFHDSNTAKKIWQIGVEKTLDQSSKETLKKLIESN